MEQVPPPRAGLAGAYAMLAVVMVLWAGNSIIGRAVRFDVPPLILGFGRWALATALLAPFAAAPVRRDWPAARRHWRVILVLGVLGIALFNSLLYTGLHHSTATNALLIQASVPAFVLAFDRALFGVRARGGQIAGVLLAGAGVGVIVFEGDPALALRLAFGRGDLLLLAAAVVWSLYTVLLRLRPPVSPITFVALTFAIGALALAPGAWGEWQAGLRVHWSPGVLAAFGYVAVLSSLAAYFLFNAATARAGAVAAGQAITLLPLFGAVLSALTLGEALHLYHLGGMALILAGVALASLAERRAGGGEGASSAGVAAKAPLEDTP